MQLLAPTDGNLYIDRTHPPANVGFNPIQHYEARNSIPSIPRPYQTIDDRTNIAEAPYLRMPLENKPYYDKNRINGLTENYR
ncbi:MAG: hypothetical protein WC254_05680 [Candidatus Woesearchaeota archaeon]|jgi:hypothetical protein